MVTTIIFLVIIFLSVQVFPIALGIDVRGKLAKALVLVIVLSAIQVFTYWLGLKLGNTFMYLMDGFSGVVVFIGFLLIGIRLLMEVFNIRKGERSYSIDTIGLTALASFAQGVNSFLVGLLFYYISIDVSFTIITLLSSVVVVTVLGIIMKPEKLTLAFASLLYTIGGLVMLVAAVYFSFFYL